MSPASFFSPSKGFNGRLLFSDLSRRKTGFFAEVWRKKRKYDGCQFLERFKGTNKRTLFQETGHGRNEDSILCRACRLSLVTLGDKTYKRVVDASLYGPSVEISKKECVEHVQKRMGTRPRACKKKIKGLGGRGKLTGKLIDELTVYYGLAIRRNSDSVEKMKNAIWATFFHKSSTDEEPKHDKCHPRQESWCSWQRAKATESLKN
ncbi:hypothetical protein J437_LFUL006117 [Ladona fulva]|uniref:Mutator-like transposase domain-containing protein n=1 Tax=Ladona fulva TaxID=123851 RepID=A0A8K0K877_LADFU|nr:hypothetical protein J437_LFUL006117 [Ladona fulva]